jgi:predicted enzyme related to lactoylglutathione lyase
MSPKDKVPVDSGKGPLGILRFLYVGSSDVAKDLDYYTKVLGAKTVWDFTSMGTRVAAVQVCSGPILLLAGHRPAPSVLPVFEVGNLKASAKEFKGSGWQSEGEEFEIPNGPCYLFKDPSGNQMALFQDVRPRLLESGFRETG